jgi:mono/diheme cytochrome c family protein
MRTPLAVRLGVLVSLLGFSLAAQTIKPVPIQPTSPASGKAMFNEYCAVCHGIDGKGDGPAASALKKPPANLSQLNHLNHGIFPDRLVANAIRGDATIGAHGSKEMPVWGDLFKSIGNESSIHMRIANLTTYVKSLQAQ